MTRICFMHAVAAGVLLLPAIVSTAKAADFPKSGEITFERYIVGKVVASAETSIGKGVLWQDTGVTRSLKGDGPFDGYEDVCLGQSTVKGEEWGRDFGTCVKTDKDGDKILVTFGEVKGEWAIVGGTGKYKGITGKGKSEGYTMLEDHGSTYTAKARDTVKWEIK